MQKQLSLIGYGSMGSRHARYARELGWTVTVADNNSESSSRAVADGFNVSDTWPTDDATALVIATPASNHFDELLSAIDTGLPTLVEKPMVTRSLDAERISRRLVAAQLVVVGYNWLFHPAVCDIRRALDRDIALHAEFMTLSNMARWPGRGYSDILLEASHDVSAALNLFGPAELKHAGRRGSFVSLQLQHRCGTTTRIVLDSAAEEEARTLRITTTHTECGYTCPPTDPLAQSALDESYRKQLEYFFARAAGDHEAVVDGAYGATVADGYAVLAICDAARALLS